MNPRLRSPGLYYIFKMEKNFCQWKKQSLNKVDLSKKGVVDDDVVHIVSLLNSYEEYFTTSSCSGRIIIIDRAPDSVVVQKKNLVWLLVSHSKCTFDDMMSALASSCGNAVLKFEPFVMHVQCRTLDDAQLLLSAALQSGFKNSGLTASKTGKIITAVRCTHSLEVPLSNQGRLLVSHEYINFLTQIANQKMEDNLRQIERFYQTIQTTLTTNKQPKGPQDSKSHEIKQPPFMDLEKKEQDKDDKFVREAQIKSINTECLA
ncbi:tRNA wybutosine-synthesizing protein 3 homolog [Dunckerocampus dactyliophorus]|uniref:tRNA wybutosine-synthesizing protein 3 homolog n=1 Tax=Dunckerocampus dactyliophorus TaxID=161453 RepID=UPI00240665FA|nr:tRNA wybutosine-synthesizing protein 3 homolog [Dunckerocampus dactyliophorus]